MVCTDTALTCAVRELNATLQGGSAWYEWVIPALVSVATLVIALLSYGVSKRATEASSRASEAAERSNELAELVHADSRRDVLRLERGAFVGEAQVWIECVARTLFLDESELDSSSAHIEERQVKALLLAVAVNLESPRGLALLESLEELNAEARERPSGWVAWYRMRAEFRLRGWQHDPDREFD